MCIHIQISIVHLMQQTKTNIQIETVGLKT